MDSNPMDPAHLMGHVKDATHFEVPRAISGDGSGRLEIPQPLHEQVGTIAPAQPDKYLDAFDLKITKFMICEVAVAIIMIVIFVGVAARMGKGGRPRGRFWNLFESFLLYIRDEIARPSIGHHDADRFLPFLWTLFFFILGCNLFGMVPWTGTATSAFATTIALALITFSVVVGSGMLKLGVVGFWKAQVPHMDLPLPLAIVLLPMIFVIEVLGLVIKHFVLAVRLLANMLAGHLVLAVIIAFIAATADSGALWYGVAPASILGATALSLLELLVAFIQAYVFTLLSALFIGMAVHPH